MSGEIIDGMAADRYHNLDRLSNSRIKKLLAMSPAHARCEYEEPASDVFDRGSAAHSLFLEADSSNIVVLDFPNWTTKAAREAREAARALGHVPRLAHQYEQALEIVLAARDGVAGIEASPPLFVDGKPEQTILWTEQGQPAKARADFLHDDYTIDDLKTTGKSAAPERITQLVFGSRYHIQAAWYLRGIEAITGRKPAFRFVFVETFPPYAVACYEMSPAALALANQQIDLALGIWKRCLERDEWPAYPTRVMTVEPTAWEETRVYEREYREEEA